MAEPKLSPRTTRIAILIALALLLISGSWLLIRPKETEFIVVIFPNGERLEAEVANTPEKLLFGLAFREGLPPGVGMLYIFDTSDRHRMWTKGYRFPVDMLWVDESRHVVHLVENAAPCPADPCQYYGPPPENARYVIQTEVGFIKREKLESGIELRFALRM